MKTLSYAEAKGKWFQLIGNAHYGEEVQITSFGEVTAVLISPDEYERLKELDTGNPSEPA
ncbi:type II toxin-antitoxin system Phd/YefM family antitoxin [Streptomyces sp. NBC_00269]|uniref:type II toxin-antitoxin system Phd/YefM family antitoxin n=1 Tax=Streptomyces sp. NBC_00269 TaxID=2975696 RepID=UPI002E27BF11|nr:type II toxin-antitoxin system Phd/YefM family antitoxin [Streptomyces sp. NBC_00269]